MSNNLFVGNISFNAAEADLFELFSKYGNVLDSKIIYDRETSRSRGFGFVTMETPEEANAAIEDLDGYDLHGRNIAVKPSIDKRKS